MMLSTLLYLMSLLPQSGPDQDIVQTAASAGSFQTLIAALEAAQLTAALEGEGPFTVFAPTDDAFAKIPQATLAGLLEPANRNELIRILTFHVVPGRADAITALRDGKFETLESSMIEVGLEGGQIKVGEANVIATDINASNGVIHVIDSVLIPPPSRSPSMELEARELIELAVSRGVPLFNNGQFVACFAIYEVAAQALRGTAAVSADGRDRLRKALDAAKSLRHPAERAWELRRALDWVYEKLADDMSAVQASVSQARDSQALFDFEEPQEPGWRLVNDDVMGGISQSEFVQTDRGTAIFRGALSLENNGGFCTVRSPGQDLSLGSSDGFELRIRGDGRTYRFGVMKSDNRMEVRVWQTNLPTEEGEWMTVRIPYDSLALSVMGRKPRNAPAIRPEQIRALSFSIADKNEQPFALEIDWIRTYQKPEVAAE